MEKLRIRPLLNLPLTKLVSLADSVRQKEAGSKLELCSIMNAKSGICSEDCRFCAQSLHHRTAVSRYPLKKRSEILKAARRAKEIGAERFDIVTSGNSLAKSELESILEAITEIKETLGIKMCASLGKLNEESLALLKEAGITRYHHNIETSHSYFPKIVTTHSFQERISTIKAAKRVGLQVCSGGIIGMGESWDDRIDMAITLKELGVDSVPLNILVPIKGTPLEAKKTLSCIDAIRTIAIFRIILRDKIIKLAAGRESLMKDFQGLAFMAGANGMLIGGYLTLKGRDIEEDRQLAKEIKSAWKQ